MSASVFMFSNRRILNVRMTMLVVKDHELAQLNDERKQLHQLLVDLQRQILTRPAAPVDDSTEPREASAGCKDAEGDVAVTGTTSTGTLPTPAAAFRHRPAHRGVTSVRVMVKSVQPPTAHSTKINLSRYNALFCNYDDAVDHRRSSTDGGLVGSEPPATFGVHPTDLTSPGAATNVDVSSVDVGPGVRPPALTDELGRGTTAVMHADGGQRLSDSDTLSLDSLRFS